VCGADHLQPWRKSNLGPEPLSSSSFRITDAAYGCTLELVRCRACGFVQLATDVDLTPFYARMDDDAYEATRPFRALEAGKLLDRLSPAGPGSRLLDVGAGSGVLVEEAVRRGWVADGVEPSAWLVARGRARGLSVHAGTLPHPALNPPYDAVTLVDVIEHVTEPRDLLREVRRVLRPGGQLLVVTPDVRSFPARMLGYRWWHYRIAHVGYFSLGTLDTLLSGSGFTLQDWRRPTRHLPLDYIWTRAARLLPLLRAVPVPRAIANATVRLNLLDSIAAIYRARTG
jgi:2-polyprenyl-3-methyl-5-hydroxy-6-metoxy-1,4-benzoquinol methylase